VGLNQSAAPPTYAPAYDVAAVNDAATPTAVPGAVGTSGRSALVPVPATSAVAPAARAPAAPVRATTVRRPTGTNSVWVNFDGRRWFNAGKAIDYDAASLTEIGTYYGYSVYRRNGDPSTIYIPAVPGRLTPYKAR
jgi:hypothetical protein